MNANSSPALAADQHRATVRAHYSERAGGADDAGCGCGCGSSGTVCCTPDSATADYDRQIGYSDAEIAAVPADARLNLGCGNPFAFADLQPGETVLDLGSGAGFDAFVAARALGGTGRVIGVDMTPAMISRARRIAAENHYDNVEFRLGEIEALPLPDASVDLIISNCVINLSPDKAAVFREAFRVLRPGGRISVSDVVSRAPLPAVLKEDAKLLSGCIAGAETVTNLRTWIEAAGFTDLRFTTKEETRRVVDEWAPEFVDASGKKLGDLLVSAIIEATKP